MTRALQRACRVDLDLGRTGQQELVAVAQLAVVAEEARDLGAWAVGQARRAGSRRRRARRRSGPAAGRPAPTPRRGRGRPPASRDPARAGTRSSPRAARSWTRRRARRTARRAAGSRARPPARGPGARAGARRRTARRPGARRGDRRCSAVECGHRALAALSPAATPHQASASSTFLSAVRCAMSADCSAIADAAVAGDRAGGGLGALRPGSRAACSCRRRWGRAARRSRRHGARG